MPRMQVRSRASAVAAVAVAALAGLLLFLSIYALRPVRGPIGWDSTQYAWRTELAQETGIDDMPARLGSGLPVKDGRPTFPALAGPLGSVQGATPLDMSTALPIALAVAVGLAGGALGLSAVKPKPMALVALAIVVTASPNVVRMLVYAYNDNMAMAAIFVAAMVAAIVALDHRGALWPAIGLHGVGGLAHLPFLAMTVPVVAGAAILLVPRSLRERRAGVSWLDTASGRMGLVAVGGPVIALVLTPAMGTGIPSLALERETFSGKLAADLPIYRFPFSLPLAGLGTWLILRQRSGAAQGAAAVMVSWLGVALVGAALFLIAPVALPANRGLVFALGLPLLVGLAFVLTSGSVGRTNRALGVAILAAGVGGVVLLGALQWLRTAPQTDPQQLSDAGLARAYLDRSGVGPGRQVVFVVDDRSRQPRLRALLMMDHLLAVLAPERVDDVRVFLGRPEDYLAGRPTSLAGSPAYAEASARFLRTIDRSADPVALLLPSYSADWSRWTVAHPGRRAGRLGVVEGPPPAPLDAVDPVPGPARTAAMAGGTLLALWVTGWGWTRALLRKHVEDLRLVALAPAVGIGALLLGAMLADRLGVRLEGFGAGAVLAAVAGSGWVAARALGTAR